VTAGGYVMEDPREAQRLAAKVDAPRWVDRYLARHLRPGMRILDVGCGPAVLAGELARRSPDVAIVGVDASAQRLEVAFENLDGLPNAEAVQGDAAALPFPDAIAARFLGYLDREDTMTFSVVFTVLARKRFLERELP
jgi:SAM-dependent methyltransferase